MEEHEKKGISFHVPNTGNEVYMLAIDFVEDEDKLVPKKMCYIIASDDLEWEPKSC